MPLSTSSRSTQKKNKQTFRPIKKRPSAPSSKRSSKPGEIAFSFDDLMGGLKDALAHAEGKLTLRTTVLPAPAPAMLPKEIRAVREGLNLSQAVFGRLLNVPSVTILKWEHGERKPSGAALRLLEIARRSPEALIAR
jgi:putative transcriptional regulator